MFCPQFRPVIGGAERQTEKLGTALVEAGYRVTILTPRLHPESPAIEELDGLTIERFPFSDLSRRYPVGGVALLNIPFVLWQCMRAVQARLKGANVLHCHMASLQTAGAALAGRISRIPVLCKAAIADERSDLGKIENTGASGRLVAWLMRKVINIWVATTAAMIDSLVRAGVKPDRIARIPNGVVVANGLSSEWRGDRVRRFLYLGRLSLNINRDVPTLVEAFDRLAARFRDLELTIVGDGDLFEQIQRLTANCSARERIHMPGFDRPERWLAWADCFVLPSRREGLSNALLEAMAAGLPCIANDIPPNREVLDNGNVGVLVPVENCDALEAAMRKMIENHGMAKHFALLAKQRAEQCYSIESVAARYVELYESLLALPEQSGL